MNVKRRQAAADPQTKPNDLGCESACTGCQSLHPLSPFIIITQPKSWYSFYRTTEVEGWVDLVGWLHTDMLYTPRTVTHLGTNRVWRSATTLIEANALPLSQSAVIRVRVLTLRFTDVRFIIQCCRSRRYDLVVVDSAHVWTNWYINRTITEKPTTSNSRIGQLLVTSQRKSVTSTPSCCKNSCKVDKTSRLNILVIGML